MAIALSVLTTSSTASSIQARGQSIVPAAANRAAATIMVSPPSRRRTGSISSLRYSRERVRDDERHVFLDLHRFEATPGSDHDLTLFIARHRHTHLADAMKKG